MTTYGLRYICDAPACDRAVLIHMRRVEDYGLMLCITHTLNYLANAKDCLNMLYLPYPQRGGRPA